MMSGEYPKVDDDCPGECRQIEWKTWNEGDEGVILYSNGLYLIPKDGETTAEAEARCKDKPKPTPEQFIEAIKNNIRAHTNRQINKYPQCPCGAGIRRCRCQLFGWGPWSDSWEIQYVVGDVTIGDCTWRQAGGVAVKTRERRGICVPRVWYKVATFIPEWDIDLTDESIAVLSDESKKLLSSKLSKVLNT